jgi:TPP-dependent indolepyruvate ferredoxin oxidoreductase alpha subunit
LGGSRPQTGLEQIPQVAERILVAEDRDPLTEKIVKAATVGAERTMLCGLCGKKIIYSGVYKQ